MLSRIKKKLKERLIRKEIYVEKIQVVYGSQLENKIALITGGAVV